MGRCNLKGVRKERQGCQEMNLKAALEAAAQVYEKRAEKNPGGKVVLLGKSTPYGEAASGIRRFIGWVYPDLKTGDIQKVVRCKDCRYYKRYKKKGQVKPVVKLLCSLDKRERTPEFYCAEGRERCE